MQDLTPVDVVLTACNRAYEVEHGEVHPDLRTPTMMEKFLSFWHTCRMPDIFNGWGGFARWFVADYRVNREK